MLTARLTFLAVLYSTYVKYLQSSCFRSISWRNIYIFDWWFPGGIYVESTSTYVEHEKLWKPPYIL